MSLKPEEVFLAQGTLRPDLIESASLVASGKAELIKTHHNDTELIRKLREEVNACENFPLINRYMCVCIYIYAHTRRTFPFPPSFLSHSHELTNHHHTNIYVSLNPVHLVLTSSQASV